MGGELAGGRALNRAYLGLLAFNVVVLGVGFALLYGLGLARSRRSGWRLVPLAYLLGWALLGSLLTFLLIAGVDPGVVTVTLVAALVVGVSIFAGRRVPKTESIATGRRMGPLATLTAFGGAAVLAIAVGAALIVAIQGTWPSEWDVWWFWIAKAKVIYYFHGLDLGVGGWGAQQSPEYPPLASVMPAAMSHWVGAFHPSLLNFQAALLGVSFLGAVPALLDRFVPRWLTFPSLALLAVTPGFWWRMQSLMVDQTLAYLVAAAAVACVIWLREPRGAWLGVATVLLVAATLTKLEGLTLGLLLVAVVAGAAFVIRGPAAWHALFLLIGPAAIVPWRLWLADHHLPTSATDYHASYLLRPGFLADRVSRFTYAAHFILHSVFRTGDWLVVLPLAVIALALSAWRVPAIAGAMAVWIVGAFLGLATVYWVSVPDLVPYIYGNADRVAATIVIVAGTLTPLLLGLALAERGSRRRSS